MMKLKHLIFYIFLLASLPSRAVTEQYQDWSIINVNGMVEAIMYNLNAQARIVPAEDKVQQYIVRPAIGYQLSQRFALWLGYQWISSNVDDDSIFSGREDRIWQRLDWKIYKNSFVNFESASRLEQRKEAAFPEWANRFRQKFILSFPKVLFSSITPILSDELFFNINKPVWVQPKTFEQNRFSVGLFIPFNSKFGVEVGYLNQYQFQVPQNQMNHILYLQANIQI